MYALVIQLFFICTTTVSTAAILHKRQSYTRDLMETSAQAMVGKALNHGALAARHFKKMSFNFYNFGYDMGFFYTGFSHISMQMQ